MHPMEGLSEAKTYRMRSNECHLNPQSVPDPVAQQTCPSHFHLPLGTMGSLSQVGRVRANVEHLEAQTELKQNIVEVHPAG